MSAPILVRLWVFDPKRPARPTYEVLVPLLHCDKTCWALLASGKRKLLGTSAFFTAASARRAQIGAIEERLSRRWANFANPRATEYYRGQLAKLRAETRH